MKHLILLKNQNKIDIKKLLLRWFINSLIKKTYGSATKNENMLVQQLPEELQKKKILENLRKEKYNHLLETTFGVLICWYTVNK